MQQRHRGAAGALALSFGVGCSGAAPLAGQAPLVEVPFTLDRNGIIVPALLNGRDSLRLLLDTGWGPLALVSTTAERLKLQLVPGGLPRTLQLSLGVGGAIQRNPRFEVFPAQELQPLIGPYDGVLSTAFFRDLVLQIDYPRRLVRFYTRSPGSRGDTNTVRVTVPMVFSSRAGALPFTDSVLVDGRPVRALFDTGGAGGFVVMRQLVDRTGLQPLSDSSVRAAMGMLSGGQLRQAPLRFARIGRISLGAIAVDSPRVVIAPDRLEGDDWGHDLIIGTGFLRDYIVTFDYVARWVTLERGGRP
jgi:predicted aspartyl protease